MFQRGKVLFFDKTKRFGFIKPDDGCPRDIHFTLWGGGRFVIDARYGVRVQTEDTIGMPGKDDVVYYEVDDRRNPTHAKCWGFATSYYDAYRVIAADGGVHTIGGLLEAKDRAITGLMMPDELHKGRTSLDGAQGCPYNTCEDDHGWDNGVMTNIAIA